MTGFTGVLLLDANPCPYAVRSSAASHFTLPSTLTHIQFGASYASSGFRTVQRFQRNFIGKYKVNQLFSYLKITQREHLKQLRLNRRIIGKEGGCNVHRNKCNQYECI